MANTVVANARGVEVILDGATDFDWTTDLSKLAPNGSRIKAIRWNPGAVDDEVTIRDGEGGPRIFKGGPALGEYDKEIEYYRGDERPEHGKVLSPFIDADECTSTSAYVYFEL